MRIRRLGGLVGLAGMLLVAPVQAAETWALLVGISRYQTPQISSLHFAADDAVAIQQALVDPEWGGLPADHVRLLVDEQATAAHITGAVDGFLKPRVAAGDHVIVFLAGHGVSKGVGLAARSFLLPANVKGLSTAALESSAVDLRALSNRLSQLPASQFVVFVDACREDPTPGRGVKGNTLTDILSRGVQVIPQERAASSVTFFSCDLGQRAFEDPRLGHGVFTYSILAGIQEGAVPQPPEGTVDMGRLAGYVKQKVEDWAKQASNDGDFEIEQTPVMMTTEVHGPVVLMRVKRLLPGSSIASTPGKLALSTVPEGAVVSVNGQPFGTTPAVEMLKDGEYTVRAEAPGYQSLERSIKVQGGYQQQVLLRLEPLAGSSEGAAQARGVGFFQQAADAEIRQQWEVAEAGYLASQQQDPKLSAAYDRLASLYLRQGRNQDAISQLLKRIARVPPTAHSYSLLSRAYAVFAQRGPGDHRSAGLPPGGTSRGTDRGYPRSGWIGATVVFRLPRDAKEAGELARRAAAAAVQADVNAPEAQLALGFALIATDRGGANKRAALAAFGRAVLLAPKDATALCGLATGIRFFARSEPDPAVRSADLHRAVGVLQEAVQRRSGYYEAHRELAYCYHLLDDLEAACGEYERANANRGAATDDAEVAGLNLALADLYRKLAETADGVKKQECVAAADGYLEDAAETTTRWHAALETLAAAGVKSRLTLSHLGARFDGTAQAPEPPRDPAPAVPAEAPRPAATGAAPDALPVDRFDLSGFPRQPTNFEEQQVLEAIRSASSPALKADAHERLARYYDKRRDATRAGAERSKAQYWKAPGR